jgi:DNA polymerase-4
MPSSQHPLTGVKSLPFNPAIPYKLFIDINSCFATVEQQYNPSLRGKPLAIAAYAGPTGTIIASSIEAKKLGIKTGMRVNEAQKIFPKLIVMEPDPPKYRTVHKNLQKVLYAYTPLVTPHSIDEFSIDIEKTPAQKVGAIQTALQIKQDIKAKVGDWITVSIGIAPNIFLAKTASNLQKPDGLKTIDSTNFLEIFKGLSLTELCGIKSGNASRLATQGIFTVLSFYQANIKTLCTAFNSIEGYYWHLKIHGWDLENSCINTFAKGEKKKSFGNSFAVPGKIFKKSDLAPILYKLVEKTAIRLRREGYKAKKFSLNILYRDGTHWKGHKVLDKYVDGTAEIYKVLFRLLAKCPQEKPVRILAESCFDVAQTGEKQLDLFESLETGSKKEGLGEAIDAINQKYGDMTVASAELLKVKTFAPDRIGFGRG